MTTSSGKKNMFNEATRVQLPALVHLTKLGYTYFGKISEEMAGTVYEPDINILFSIYINKRSVKIWEKNYLTIYRAK